jgi:HEAT repeat protein
MKRPALIPMLDSHVMGFLFRRHRPLRDGRLISDLPAAGVMAMKQFRQLMLHGDNLKALTAIRDDLAPWLTRLDVSSGGTPSLSLVRVLDSLLWYDWKGHESFGTTALEQGLAPAALIDRLRDTDHAIRWRAAKALGGFGPAAQEVVTPLAELEQDENEGSLVRWWAAVALKQIDPKRATQTGAP